MLRASATVMVESRRTIQKEPIWAASVPQDKVQGGLPCVVQFAGRFLSGFARGLCWPLSIKALIVPGRALAQSALFTLTPCRGHGANKGMRL